MTLELPEPSGDQAAELEKAVARSNSQLRQLSRIIESGDWRRKKAEYEEEQRAYILEYLNSDNPEQRAKAASFWWFHDVQRELFPSLFRDPDPSVRLALVNNLWAQARFPTLHQDLIHDPDPQVRKAMIEISPIWDSPRLVRLLLNDPDQEVRIAVLKRWRPWWGSSDLVSEMIRSDAPEIVTASRRNRSLQRLFGEVRDA